MFQHTAARRRLQDFQNALVLGIKVSTHSRPKAAAYLSEKQIIELYSFNTQPPEGGCHLEIVPLNHKTGVSTHSRPKAAAFNRTPPSILLDVSTHSRPKAAAFHRLHQ